MLNTCVRSPGRLFVSIALFILTSPVLAVAADQTAIGGPLKPWWFLALGLVRFLSRLGCFSRRRRCRRAASSTYRWSADSSLSISIFVPRRRSHGRTGRGPGRRTGVTPAQSCKPASGSAGSPHRLLIFYCRGHAGTLSFSLESQHHSIFASVPPSSESRCYCFFRKILKKPVVNNQDAIGLALGLRGRILGTTVPGKVLNGKPIGPFQDCSCSY